VFVFCEIHRWLAGVDLVVYWAFSFNGEPQA